MKNKSKKGQNKYSRKINGGESFVSKKVEYTETQTETQIQTETHTETESSSSSSISSSVLRPVGSCPPGKELLYGTCLTERHIIEMIRAHNRYTLKTVQGNPQVHSLIDEDHNNPKKMLAELAKRYQTTCKGDQECLFKQDFLDEMLQELRDDVKLNTLLPEGPETATTWLSNFDIQDIMRLRENYYPDFEFIGAVPMDCDEHSICPLSRLDLKNLYSRGKMRLAIVYNLDKMGQGGSHWVAMYMDLNKCECYYYNSLGTGPVENMNNMIEQFKKFCINTLKKNPLVKINNKQHQRDTSECGVYSVNFIIRLLRGETYESIINDETPFEEINSCRNAYFRKKTSKFPVSHKC
jgi:hypothetical protein